MIDSRQRKGINVNRDQLESNRVFDQNIIVMEELKWKREIRISELMRPVICDPVYLRSDTSAMLNKSHHFLTRPCPSKQSTLRMHVAHSPAHGAS